MLYIALIILIIGIFYRNNQYNNDLYYIDSIILENDTYYGIIKTSNKSCKYKIKELNDFNIKIIIEIIGIDAYSNKYIKLKKNNRYILYHGEYCTSDIEV